MQNFLIFLIKRQGANTPGGQVQRPRQSYAAFTGYKDWLQGSGDGTGPVGTYAHTTDIFSNFAYLNKIWATLLE